MKRADLERLQQQSDVTKLVESLRRQGVSDEVLQTAVSEARVKYEV